VFTIGASYEDAFYGQLKYIHENLEPDNAVYGVIRQEDDFGVTVEAGYDRAVREFGLKDGIRLRYTRGTTNFATEVAQMNAAGVNVLANGAIIAGAANVLSEARKLDMDMQVASVWSENMPPSVNLSAPAGYDYLVADYVALTGPAVDDFLERARQHVTEEELAGLNRYTYVTYLGLKVLAHAMAQCGQELTRACTIEQLGKIRDFDTEGLSGPLSFDNELQLTGTALAIYQLNAAEKTFTALTDFIQY
jgi:ABC-type branched-subunit amino acid transport system substrate-binding protein